MNTPAPKTSPDAALGNLLGAALGTPDTARPIGTPPDQPPSYGAPAEIAQRIERYIGRYGREDTATLLLYEAMNALRHHAPAAGDAQIAAYAMPDGTRVERAAQSDGAYLWAVRRNGDCLGRDRHWSYEPLPSSRSEEWLALHRFPTAQAAIDAAIAAQQGKGGAA